MQKNRYGIISLVLTALAFPLAVFIGTLLELVLKSRNSQNISIAIAGAYQQPVRVTSGILFLVLMIAGMVFAIIALKKSSGSAVAKVSLVVIAVISLLVVGGCLIQKQTNAVESQYQKTQLNDFLKKLSL